MSVVVFTLTDGTSVPVTFEVPRETLKSLMGALEALVGDDESAATIRIPDLGLVDGSPDRFRRAALASYAASPADRLERMFEITQTDDWVGVAEAIEWLRVA